MLRLRDVETGELTEVLPAGRRQLRIFVHAPAPAGPGQTRAYLTADLLRRTADVSRLLPLVSDFLPVDADMAELRSACAALNIHPPRDTFIGPATALAALAGIAPFDVGIAVGKPGEIADSARLWIEVAAGHDVAEDATEPLSARLRLLRLRYGDPAPAGGGGNGEVREALTRWRSLVAQWARSPSGAMSRPHAEAISDALADDLDTPTALRVLAELADDRDVPDGVKFETFAAADRLLALDLARDIGK